MRDLVKPNVILATGLAPQLVSIVVDGSQTVGDIVAAAGFLVPDHPLLEVSIGTHIVPFEHWHRVRPKPESTALMRIACRPLSGGGGSGGGSILKTVLSVLLVAAAVAITGGAAAFSLGGGPLFGATGFTLFGAGSFEASLAAAAVLGLGQAGLNALFPSAVTAAGTSAAGGRSTAGARSNVLRAGDYLPRPFGTLKVWPPQVTKPIRWLEANGEVVEALYAVAGRTLLEDVRIGGVPYAEVDGVTVQVVDWDSPLDTQSLLTRYGAVRTVGRPLQWYKINRAGGSDLYDQVIPERSAPAWDSVVFPDADEMRIRLSWPEGLNKRADNSTQVLQPMRVRFRLVGTTTWTNGPEIWWRNDGSGEYRKDIVLRRPGVPALVSPVTDFRKAAAYLFAQVPGQGLYSTLADGTTLNGGSGSPGAGLSPKSGAWQADALYTSGSPPNPWEVTESLVYTTIYQEGVGIHVGLGRGALEVQVIAGAVLSEADFDEDLYAYPHTSWGLTTLDFFGYATRAGYSAAYAPGMPGDYAGAVVIDEAVAIMHAAPTIGIGRANAAVIAVRGRNVQVGDVTAIATSVVETRDGSGWVATDNPAVLSEALARGESTHRGVSARIDTDAYDGWGAECVSKGYRASFEANGTRWDDVQRMLASAGRGGFAMGRGFRPYWDRDRSAEAATMAFTPANARYLGLSRSWAPVRTDALRITHRDRSNDFQEASRIIYAPGVDGTSYRGLEDVQYPELADVALADARAAYDLAVMRYRGARLEFETDHAAEAVEKGDLVVCVWDVLAEADASHGIGERAASQSAYIAEVTRNFSGQVIGITLERPVYVEPSEVDFFALTDVFDAPNVMAIGDAYVGLVTVGRADPDDPTEAPGMVLELALDISTAGPATEIAIVPASVPRASQVAAGQIFTVGRMRRLRRRSIVESITLTGGYFRIVTVPEAPEIWA